MTIDKFTDGQLDSVIYAYENELIHIYQVEDMLDYICVDWNDFVRKLTVSDCTIEALQFMQQNGYKLEKEEKNVSVMDEYRDKAVSPGDFLSKQL